MQDMGLFYEDMRKADNSDIYFQGTSVCGIKPAVMGSGGLKGV